MAFLHDVVCPSCGACLNTDWQAAERPLVYLGKRLVHFSDAPRTPEAAEAVREVREYIKTISGFRSISIVERDKNLGLANSIIDGVTRLCNEYGRVL